MKNFFKNYLINIIFGTIAFMLLLCAFLSLFDWIINPLFWIAEGIFIALTFCLPKRNKGNNDEKKEFRLFTKFKITLIAIMLLVDIYLAIKMYNAPGWDGLPYFIYWIANLVVLILILITNFIIRIYYRIKYNQIFKKGIISNLIFIIILILIFICIHVILMNIL